MVLSVNRKHTVLEDLHFFVVLPSKPKFFNSLLNKFLLCMKCIKSKALQKNTSSPGETRKGTGYTCMLNHKAGLAQYSQVN